MRLPKAPGASFPPACVCVERSKGELVGKDGVEVEGGCCSSTKKEANKKQTR
jgi:hypothetical protein